MKVEEKLTAISLRKKGYSIKEIAKLLNVSKSSASIWGMDVHLDARAKKRLLGRIKLGQYNSAEKKKSTKNASNQALKDKLKLQFGNVELAKKTKQIICSLIYWCEGAKDDGLIAFTNSDPYLTRFFLNLLIESYGAKRNKFVARLHLHEYHNSEQQEKFWGNILKLKESQFRKAYKKPHTGKRYRDNYPGCISLRYYDSMLARKLMYLAQNFTGGMV